MIKKYVIFIESKNYSNKYILMRYKYFLSTVDLKELGEDEGCYFIKELTRQQKKSLNKKIASIPLRDTTFRFERLDKLKPKDLHKILLKRLTNG